MIVPLKEGQVFGKDVSTLGTFEQNGQTITGTANKVTEYTQFSSDPNEQEGYYYAFNIEPWEGVTYSSAKHPEPKPLKDDGHLVLFLGKEAPEKKYVDFHYTDGSTVRYWVDVTAALPSRIRTVAKKAAAKKASK